MRPTEFLRSTTLRWSLGLAGAFAVSTLISFGFIYWHAVTAITARIDSTLEEEAELIAAAPPAQRLAAIEARVHQDIYRNKLTGLFDAGQRLAGNLAELPGEVVPGATARAGSVRRVGEPQHALQARVLARRLPDGQVLVLARMADELGPFARTLERALVIAIFPALGFAVLAAVFLSRRAQRRVGAVAAAAARIVSGDLRERLPTRDAMDAFDQLARIVNAMLDEIEGLMGELAQVGNDIAHDLRTPLTRVRAALERARENAGSLAELQAAVDRAIVGLDKSLAIITALLRIAEIEHGRRFAGFGTVDLADLLQEIAELYAPMAEDKSVTLGCTAAVPVAVRGDRDLLFEAIANLLDNAMKFTPGGGSIELSVTARDHGFTLRVADTGPGIPEAERGAVTRPFYRSDKSRNTPGSGLGLSLVAAIVKLHGFALSIGAGPGGVVELSGRLSPSSPLAGAGDRFDGSSSP